MNYNTVNLNAELREWLGGRLGEVLGTNPQQINNVVLDIHEAKEDIVRLVYNYQLRRNWPSVVANTSRITGYDESAIRKMRRRKRRV